MKDHDWWWNLRKEFKKTDPAAVMQFGHRRMQSLEKSIMDQVSKTEVTWAKKKKSQKPSPNP